jgi:hypothetical protein
MARIGHFSGKSKDLTSGKLQLGFDFHGGELNARNGECQILFVFACVFGGSIVTSGRAKPRAKK